MQHCSEAAYYCNEHCTELDISEISITHTGHVIVADIYMLTHCQQEKRGRLRTTWQLCCMLGGKRGLKKNPKKTTEREVSSERRPIISEMAGELLKCEIFFSFSGIYRAQTENRMTST